MTARTCESCKHHKIERVWGRDDHRCMRVATSKGGKKYRNLSCAWETDSVPDAYRKDGDKCGPDRIHWEVIK